jgi:hypothetical protein
MSAPDAWDEWWLRLGDSGGADPEAMAAVERLTEAVRLVLRMEIDPAQEPHPTGG